MQSEADIILDGLGGTSAVARMAEAPISTVHSWRRNGIPKSRMAHLRLLARDQGIAWPLDSAPATAPSPGKSADFTASPAGRTAGVGPQSPAPVQQGRAA